jgi:hypothetical protein
MGSWEDEEEPEPDGTLRVSSCPSTPRMHSRACSTHDDPACLLAPFADEEDEEDTAFDDGESGSRKKSASSAHVPISLFDQVLRGASEQVYDPHIGQYVEKTAIEADAKVEDEQTQSGTNFRHTRDDFIASARLVRSPRARHQPLAILVHHLPPR